jgi:ABC-type multidrug transport system ATPase subunit
MIRVRDLRKRYRDPSRGDPLAVDRLSFEVSPGEVYGLLGPNGAGKTTTLRILATLLEPDEGEVVIAGVDRRKDPLGVRERIAWVPAEAGLPERLTPREVVRLFAGVQGVADADRRADAMIERLGCSSYAGTPCGDLSTGMKRRVVLARALVHEPQVLLLDEPTDGLDVPGRREVLDLVVEQARAGKTVVVSSHVMAEVQRVVDRLGVVNHGRMVGEGTLDQVLSQANAASLDDAFLALLKAG